MTATGPALPAYVPAMSGIASIRPEWLNNDPRNLTVGIGRPSMPSTINFELTAKLYRGRGNRVEQAQRHFPPAAQL
jgi:hypothetical protein